MPKLALPPTWPVSVELSRSRAAAPRHRRRSRSIPLPRAIAHRLELPVPAGAGQPHFDLDVRVARRLQRRGDAAERRQPANAADPGRRRVPADQEERTHQVRLRHAEVTFVLGGSASPRFRRTPRRRGPPARDRGWRVPTENEVVRFIRLITPLFGGSVAPGGETVNIGFSARARSGLGTSGSGSNVRGRLLSRRRRFVRPTSSRHPIGGPRR